MASNNRYLLDTHIFIWWMEGNKNLDPKIKNILIDPRNAIYLSVITVWEIVIKKKIEKYTPPKNWKEDIRNSTFDFLRINLEHALELEDLPLHHKDPFDRMLIAQAKAEKLTFITADPKMKKYKIPLIGQFEELK